jgi:rhodanese-related sulfurtransferase
VTTDRQVTHLDPAAAHRLLATQPQVRILDVRTPLEHARHRLAGSLLVPIQQLAQRLDDLDADADWLVYCEHGIRSRAACAFLSERGFQRVHNLLGGIAQWLQLGLPHERGSAPPSRRWQGC